tara:strand:+ start:62 stop:469 length:408 start_codon:yes stop_codon:yes gene_type:complete
LKKKKKRRKKKKEKKDERKKTHTTTTPTQKIFGHPQSPERVEEHYHLESLGYYYYSLFFVSSVHRLPSPASAASAAPPARIALGKVGRPIGDVNSTASALSLVAVFAFAFARSNSSVGAAHALSISNQNNFCTMF